MLLLALIVLLQASATTEADPGNLSEDLFYAGSSASGSRLCDRAKAREYAADFKTRYGERIQALLSYHESRFGRDPDFIITSSCMSSPKRSDRQQYRDHQKALARFEKTLEALERRYGQPRSIGSQ